MHDGHVLGIPAADIRVSARKPNLLDNLIDARTRVGRPDGRGERFAMFVDRERLVCAFDTCPSTVS